MYIIANGPLFLKDIGETNELGQTNISMTMDITKAMLFNSEKEATETNDKYDQIGKVKTAV